MQKTVAKLRSYKRVLPNFWKRSLAGTPCIPMTARCSANNARSVGKASVRWC